ncbi:MULTISPECIES: ABC transporter permease [unclassified Rhizobium]|uniref:ABC transporter permease n=1 Tax=unclassified Rhizobium TaxID=2613769 RepID=UPI001ADD4FCB|nr:MULTISPECIES: ABC transporter permease [unclassified Rhizobium]MBO9123740.1 ABC transporter permease [Rhizobium sp. 16-488-2b]MBO9174272.1 ABC transporter permease [Rhizobium sp. 16-488-2a]
MKNRWSWLIRRILIGLLLLIVVSALIFAATQALPGDVAAMMLGEDATPAQLAHLRSQLHLDQPVIMQYLTWLGGILTGNLGMSVTAGQPVWSLLSGRIANTFTLVTVSIILALPTSITLGLLAGYYKDSWFDKGLMAISLGVNALPEFVLGVLLVVIFSTNLMHILPAVSLISPEQSIATRAQAFVLPCLTMFLLQTTYLYRLVRASVIDVLSTDYIQFAILKGLSQKRVLFRHALPNAAVPTLQATATVFAVSVGGIVVVEYVFNFPGMGTALTDAVGNRDLTVVQFIVLLIATTFFIANIVADLFAAALTPPGRGSLK